MFKFVDRKKLLRVFILSIIQGVTAYGMSFLFSYYATSPLTVNKLYNNQQYKMFDL